MVYVAWARGARRGDEHVSLLKVGMAMTYASILVNLFGGFIRTYAPGHPRISEMFQEPWAVVMLVKHLFLFVGMFAAVYLYEVVAPRIRRRVQAGSVVPTGRKEALAVGAVATAILISTVLGAIAAVTPIGDGMEPGTMVDPTATPSDPDGVLLEDGYYNFTGRLTSLPIQPDTAEGTYKVPTNTGQLEAVLTWSDQVAALDLELDLGGTKTTEAGRVTVVVTTPSSGDTAFTVLGQNALNVAWDLSIRLSPAQGGQALLVDQFTIAPGAQVNFFEINTEMPLHGNASWSWQTNGGPADFNVHTHFDEQVQYLVEETATEGTGSLTAHRAGGYSWMWENPNPTPLTIEYRVWGDFTVDSYFPNEPTAFKLGI